MIARVWSAHTTPALSESYLQHFEQAVQPQLRRVDGFLGATVSTRPVSGSVEILVTTYWASFMAVDAFAGVDREAAVVAQLAPGAPPPPRRGVDSVEAPRGTTVFLYVRPIVDHEGVMK